MSTLRVNNIELNPYGNTIISAVNTNNIVITVDGTEKLKVAKEGVNFRGPISVNSAPIFGGAGEFIATINLVNQVSNVLNVASGGTSGLLPVANGGTGVTTATGTGSVVLANTSNISVTTITGLRETRVAMPANDINLLNGNYFTKTISGTTTLTVSNVPTSGTASSFILDLTNGGSATINWWSGVKWATGVAPTLTSSGRDVLGFFTHDAGTNWNGILIAKDIK